MTRKRVQQNEVCSIDIYSEAWLDATAQTINMLASLFIPAETYNSR